MKKHISLALFAAILGLTAFTPQPSEARVFVGVGVGCCGGYGYGPAYPYYPGYYPAYYPPAYYAPPAYYPPPAYTVPASMIADQTSPTFVDSYGRTCRRFEATGAYAAGTACEMSDGTWRVVQ